MGHQRLAARQCRLKSADFIWQSFFPQGQQMSAVFFSWSDLLSLLSGNWLLPPSVSVTVPGVSGISDDSRDLLRGNLFVAIVGETADGHRFLPQAVAAGAAAVCVETAPEPEIRQLLHENACPCLQAQTASRHSRPWRKRPPENSPSCKFWPSPAAAAKPAPRRCARRCWNNVGRDKF